MRIRVARETCREETPADYDGSVPGQRAACFRLRGDHPYWDAEPIEVAAGRADGDRQHGDESEDAAADDD